jgi:hypothetical protein
MSMRSSRPWYWGVLLLCAVGAFAVWQYQTKKMSPDTPTPATRPAMLTSDAYHATVQRILAEHTLGDVAQLSATDDISQQVVAARAALLLLVIPTEERDAHLALMLALGQIGEGAAGHDALSETKGLAALQTFFEKYPWARVEKSI